MTMQPDSAYMKLYGQQAYDICKHKCKLLLKRQDPQSRAHVP